MTVKEMIAKLRCYPENMEVLNERRSDYCIIMDEDFSVVGGVLQEGQGWVMRSHPTMSEENKSKEKKYLLIEGN